MCEKREPTHLAHEKEWKVRRKNRVGFNRLRPSEMGV